MMIWPLQKLEKKKRPAINRARKRILMIQMRKKGHYLNECDKEQTGDKKTVKASNKSVSNFLMMNENQHG